MAENSIGRNPPSLKIAWKINTLSRTLLCETKNEISYSTGIVGKEIHCKQSRESRIYGGHTGEPKRTNEGPKRGEKSRNDGRMLMALAWHGVLKRRSRSVVLVLLLWNERTYAVRWPRSDPSLLGTRAIVVPWRVQTGPKDPPALHMSVSEIHLSSELEQL